MIALGGAIEFPIFQHRTPSKKALFLARPYSVVSSNYFTIVRKATARLSIEMFLPCFFAIIR